jgi:hypothetical protein
MDAGRIRSNEEIERARIALQEDRQQLTYAGV